MLKINMEVDERWVEQFQMTFEETMERKPTNKETHEFFEVDASAVYENWNETHDKENSFEENIQHYAQECAEEDA